MKLARGIVRGFALPFGLLALTPACGSSGTTWIGSQDLVATGGVGGMPPAACEPIGPGDACTTLPARDLPRLTVQDNQLLQNGKPYHLYAIARSELLWGEQNRDGCSGDDHFHDADLDAIASWRFNSVRIGLSQARWFGRACDAATYATRVEHAVAMANAHGLYAILELHWTDLSGRAPCGAACTVGLVPMPDQESVSFWRQVAARYGDNPGVVFDIFNEPSPPGDTTTAATCWRDGGCDVSITDPLTLTYQATGMQALVDAARGAAPLSVLLVTGPEGGTNLDPIARGTSIADSQIVYAAHMYNRGFAESDWLARFGSLSAQYPVMVTELGSLDCSADETTRLLDYVDAPLSAPAPATQIGWGIRSWNLPGDCGYPSVIADFDGTPLGAQGAAAQAHLRAYGPSAGPVPP